MTIPTEHIRKFLSESANIPANVLFPGLSETIKITCSNGQASMSKTNRNVFCTYRFDCSGEADEIIMVSEKALNGLAQTTTSNNMHISQLGNVITIQGTKSEKVKTPEIDKWVFPQMPELTPDPITLPVEALKAIRIASKYILRQQLVIITCFVHVTEKGIVGSNGNSIVYSRKFSDLPDLLLGEEALQVIRTDRPALYYSSEGYDFFDYGDLMFGVVKNAFHTKTLDMSIPFAVPGNPCFIVNRQDLLHFCTMVNYNAVMPMPDGIMRYDGQNLTLVHDDPANHVHVFREIDCVTNIAPCDDFKFPVKYLEVILKSLPYDQLTWLRAGNHFYIASPEDEAYKGLLAGIA